MEPGSGGLVEEPNVVGQMVKLSGEAYTIVGVLAPGLSICARGQRGVLGAPAAYPRVREAAELPQSRWRGPVAKTVSRFRGPGRDEVDRRCNWKGNIRIRIAATARAWFHLSDAIVGDIRPILLVLLWGAGLLCSSPA